MLGTKRPENIEWVLGSLHEGSWFAFREEGQMYDREHTYENLVMIPGNNGVVYEKPTEKFLLAELAKAQAEWDEANAPYVLSRRAAYLPIADQLDMQYHDSVNGTTTWVDHIAAVKAKYPKP